jgi:hypothetical protein
MYILLAIAVMFSQVLVQKYSRTLLIRALVIRIVDYPDTLGPSGKSVENSTKLTCLGTRSSTVEYYGFYRRT